MSVLRPMGLLFRKKRSKKLNIFGPINYSSEPFYFTELPPPVPADLETTFSSLVNLLQCEVMLHLMYLMLQRTSTARSRAWSEAQFDRVSHVTPDVSNATENINCSL